MKTIFKRLINHALRWRDFIAALIFPAECLSCGREGDWLCKACFYKIKTNDRQSCLSCGKKKDFGKICKSCRSGHSLDGLWVAGHYSDELTKRLVKSLKYGLVRDLALTLGMFLALFLRDMINTNHLNREIRPLKILENIGEALLIPIPIHPKRQRWRGFNQSQLIAENMAERLRLSLSVGELVRVRQAEPQAKIDKRRRLENIKGCFAWQSAPLCGRNIILLDDVATTGATLNEAAKVLKENGAGQIWGLVVARG